VTWSETRNVKWKFPIPGYGTSTPIIWGDQVFVVTAVPTGKKTTAFTSTATALPTGEAPPAPPGDVQPSRPRRSGPAGPGGPGGGMRPEQPTEVQAFTVIAVDRQTGKPRWQKVAREQLPHEGHHRDHGYASFSPVTDGEHLYAYFGSRGLYAYDLQGNLKWEKDLGDMQTRAGFGEGGSLALHGDTLVVQWDHEGADFMAALDKRTGQERWRKEWNEDTTWSTPLVVTHGGRAQVVANASNRVRSYDLLTGEQLWECGGMTANVIPTPVSDGELVYAISGFRGAALLAIRLGKTGDLTDSADAIAWRHTRNTPYVPSPLLYDGRLYFCSGNNAMLSSFDTRTGKPLFDAERIEGVNGVYASPLGAAGRVYLVGRDGNTAVLKHGDRLEVLATNRLEDKFDASAAAIGKELYLRGQRNLYCLAE
jgi:outer membrane protein assembly factor BamB